MSAPWYGSAKDNLKKLIEQQKEVQGPTFLDDFVHEFREDYFPDLDSEDISDHASDEFSDFENWLKKESFPWLEVLPRGKWSLKNNEDDDKSHKDRVTNDSILSNDIGLSLTDEETSLLDLSENEIKAIHFDLYSSLFNKLERFTEYSKTAECAFKLAYCYELNESKEKPKLVEYWSVAAKASEKAKNSILALISYKNLGEIYKSNGGHSDSAINYEKAYNFRDKKEKSKKKIEEYIRLARYSRVQYDLDGDHKSASRMFIHEKNTEYKIAHCCEKVVLRLHQVISCYGEKPYLVIFWALLLILISSLGFYFVGTSDFCSSEMLDFADDDKIKGLECTSGLENFGQSLYMSFVTFTTLGYGEITPVTITGKVISSVLAVMGLIFTSLFMVTFVRKYSRP
ncbi:potassium channel family protein [Vibrio splendidus]